MLICGEFGQRFEFTRHETIEATATGGAQRCCRRTHRSHRNWRTVWPRSRRQAFMSRCTRRERVHRDINRPGSADAFEFDAALVGVRGDEFGAYVVAGGDVAGPDTREHGGIGDLHDGTALVLVDDDAVEHIALAAG